MPEVNSYSDICIPLKNGKNDCKYFNIFSVMIEI